MMKIAATLVTIFSCSAASALPAGNPSEASTFLCGVWWEGCGPCNPCDPCFRLRSAWSLRIGYAGDFVYNRHLQVHRHHHDGRDIDRTSRFTNAGYFAFNVCNYLDLFGTLGATKLHIKTNALSWGFTGPGSLESELFFSPQFSWSFGARATLWQCDCYSVGMEGQYFQTNPNVDRFLEYRAGTSTYFNGDTRACYSEWQVSIGTSYRYATSCPTLAMIPYFSVNWSGAHLGFRNLDFTETFAELFDASPLHFERLEHKKLWGYAVGLSFILCDTMGVTLEGRFASEKALSFNGQLRF